MADCARDEEMGLPDDQVPLLSQPYPQKIPDCRGNDTVQFAAPIYYVDENEGKLEVDIIRLGSMKGVVAVEFYTSDGTAMQDTEYVGVSGQLVFEDGEHTKTISISVLPNDEWTTTQEFQIHLTSAQNCQLGLYLYECRAKILNADKFPTDFYGDDIEKGEVAINNIPDWGLYFEYLQLTFWHGGVHFDTCLVLVIDQINNLFLFLTLWVGVYIVDTIFSQSASGDLLLRNRYHTAVLVALWFILPTMFSHAWDALKVMIDIKGTARKFLQASLVRLYLDYNEEARLRVTEAEVDMCLDGNAEECADSYVSAVNIVAVFGKIITLAVFIVMFQPDRFAIYCVLIPPTILIIFAYFRAEVFRVAQKNVEEKMLLLKTMGHEACTKIRLIEDYFARHAFGKQIQAVVQQHSEELIPATLIDLNTQYVTKTLCGMVIFIYIVVKTPAVLDKTLSLGIFLSSISIFGSYLAEAINDLNRELKVIIKSFVPLKEFTLFFNLPLELPPLKELHEKRRQETKAKHSLPVGAPAGQTQGCWPTVGGSQGTGGQQRETVDSVRFDSLPIEVSNLSFEYADGTPVFSNVSVAVQQGKMVAVVGNHQSGKQTLMALLSNILTPTSGFIYIPTHIRVLHVSREPMLLRASLICNLALGLPKARIDTNRIRSIVELLGLGDMVALLDRDLQSPRTDISSARANKVEEGGSDNDSDLQWARRLSQSGIAKIHLARALIANPEVLVLQRPFESFQDDLSLELLAILNRHVQERGLFLPEEGRASRRPRTIFYNTESAIQAKEADVIWQIQPYTKTIKVIEKSELGKTLNYQSQM